MLRILLIAVALVFGTISALAHPQGHGTLSEEDARILAANSAAYLVNNKVDKEWSPLTQSWSLIPVSQTKIIAKVDSYYVVSVHNPEEDETLYLLIGTNGDVVDANFSGEFPFVYDLNNPDQTPAAE
ncbi:hypothetical protein SIAM614_28776 [Stappia aggregata IAM 12614]|uniref:PepSY domain-containing protein n=2 Tax=Roseibium aggregatum TaxID=187304 RepID=A0P4B7_ROSAI|nr:hypothetical protein SIAM614_28776 [Stappia aggregata IAM 12614] [Roseibium aggregatum IAM 12614]